MGGSLAKIRTVRGWLAEMKIFKHRPAHGHALRQVLGNQACNYKCAKVWTEASLEFFFVEPCILEGR